MQYYHNVKAAEALIAASKNQHKSFEDAEGIGSESAVASAQDMAHVTGSDDNSHQNPAAGNVSEGAMVLSRSGTANSHNGNKAIVSKNRYAIKICMYAHIDIHADVSYFFGL
jgi:hypothetical protein